MSTTEKRKTNKRKNILEEDEGQHRTQFSSTVGLAMDSDEEEDENAVNTSDGEADEFPEIDSRSDSEDELSDSEVGEEEEGRKRRGVFSRVHKGGCGLRE